MQTERIGDLDARALDDVTPARHPVERVLHAQATADPAEVDPLLSEPAYALDQGRHRGRNGSARLELNEDRDVVALDVVAETITANRAERTVHEPDPEPRQRRDQ